MYEVRVQDGFSAVHQLRMHGGGLEPLHGHDWKVEAVFRGPRLDEIEVLVDFGKAAGALHQVVGRLDHCNLNAVALLEGRNPSAEVVARAIFGDLCRELGDTARPAAVYVEEAPGCHAGYSESSA